jgi:hypothetical protein
MPPGRARGRARGGVRGGSAGRGQGRFDSMSPQSHSDDDRNPNETPIDPPQVVDHLDEMLATIKPRGGTIQVKTWRGGQGFGEFRNSYRQQAIGAGWRSKEQVVRLIAFLGGLPAKKYEEWLKQGHLKDATLDEAFKMLAQEFFDEEEERHSEKEKWTSRKQKADESVEEYHTIFIANADGAGIVDDKELVRQWSRNLLPSIRSAVRTALHSNASLSFQSAVRIAMDVEAMNEEDDMPMAYRKKEVEEDKYVKKVRAIASAAAESVVKSMENEIAQAKRELQKAREEIDILRAAQEGPNPRYVAREQRRWEPYPSRGRGGTPPWQRGRGSSNQTSGGRQGYRPSLQCGRCSSTGHHESACTYDGVCYTCGKKGHKASVCRSRARPEALDEEPSETSGHPKDKRSSA